jgi:hypothetical protein
MSARRFALLLVAVAVAVGSALALFSGGLSPSSTPTGAPPSTTAPAPTSGPGGMTRFGVIFSTRISPDDQVRVARELGVRYIRPSSAVFLEAAEPLCSSCDVLRGAGFGLVLTVRNSEGPSGPAGSGQELPASSPPTDLAAYRAAVGRVIDQYHPTMVVVENEENVSENWTGTPEQYGDMLEAACAAAHDRDILCTNGGLLSGAVTYFVYQHLLDSGNAAEASSYADRAFEGFQHATLAGPGGPAKVAGLAARVQDFLMADRASGADYVNIHWYVADPQALAETVAAVRDVTGLPVVSNETGQRDEDPATTTGVLQEAVRLGLPYLIWYTPDARLARGIVNTDGTLRATGDAFSAFVRSHS